MTNEQFTISEELEQLRTEYAELKSRLDKQEITNEKLIRESIRKDLRLVHTKTLVSLIAGIAALGIIPLLSLHFNLSLTFMIISIVWMLGMVIGNFIRNREISCDSISGESTQAFLAEIKKRKKNQFRWIRVNYSIFLIWVAYFIAECFRSGMAKEMLLPLVSGIVAGALLGSLLGLRMHNRIIGAYEGIILELENPEAARSIMK